MLPGRFSLQRPSCPPLPRFNLPLQLRNRKNGAAMRRVFVHGVFRKPLGAPASAASPAA